MIGWRKKLLVFICAAAMMAAMPAKGLQEEPAVDLSGRWVSLQYGSLTFTQTGNSFTAKWSGQTAAGTLTGTTAVFTYWAGKSYDTCNAEEKGQGSLIITGNGNMLQGKWANVSKKDPESGSFSAMRVASIIGNMPANPDMIGPDSGETEIKVEAELPVSATPAPETGPMTLFSGLVTSVPEIVMFGGAIVFQNLLNSLSAPNRTGLSAIPGDEFNINQTTGFWSWMTKPFSGLATPVPDIVKIGAGALQDLLNSVSRPVLSVMPGGAVDVANQTTGVWSWLTKPFEKMTAIGSSLTKLMISSLPVFSNGEPIKLPSTQSGEPVETPSEVNEDITQFGKLMDTLSNVLKIQDNSADSVIKNTK